MITITSGHGNFNIATAIECSGRSDFTITFNHAGNHFELLL